MASISPQGKFRVIGTHLVGKNGVVAPKPLGAIRLVCQSDTHSRIERKVANGEVIIPEGDIYVHTGDFTSTGTFTEVNDFRAYLLSLPHPHKVVIAGNHDLTFHTEYYLKRGGARFHSKRIQDPEACRRLLTECEGVTYLEDSGVNVLGLNFYGSPWQPEFYDWAFNASRGSELREIWRKIPSDADVVMTHGPPLGHGDRLEDGSRVGCEELAECLFSRVRPALHVFGHIHEDFGVTTQDGITFVNASTCTLQYRPTNPTVVVDLIQ